MNAEPDVVVQFRTEVIKRLEFAVDLAGPTVLEEVLAHVATVPYRGHDRAYVAEAAEALKMAAEAALRPHIEAFQADTAALRAQTEEMEARHARFMREYEAFWRMKTPTTIQ